MKKVLLVFLMVLSVFLIGCEGRSRVPDFRFADFSILEKGMSFEYAKSILGEPDVIANHENIGLGNFMKEDDFFPVWSFENNPEEARPRFLSANFSENEINTIQILPRGFNTIERLTFEISGDQFTEYSAFETFGMPGNIWIFENGETIATWQLRWNNGFLGRVEITFLDGVSINIREFR